MEIERERYTQHKTDPKQSVKSMPTNIKFHI